MSFRSPFVRALGLGSAAVFLLLSGAAAADRPGKSAPAGAKLYSATYDVRDIVAKRTFWDLARWARNAGSQRPWQSAAVGEGLVRSLLDCLVGDDPKRAGEFLGKQARQRIRLVNGNKLEVHGDKKTHEEVKNVLAAFGRSVDLAVVVECWLYEVDRKVYDQQIVGKWHRRPGSPAIFADPATEETEKKFLGGAVKADDVKADFSPFYKGRKALQRGKVTIQDRERGEIFSRRTAVPYERSPGGGTFVKKGEKELACAFPGFSFSMNPVVSHDRRMVHINLTQKVTQLLEWQKTTAHEVLPNQDWKGVVFEVPVLQEASFTSHFTVFDGWPVVARVRWQRPGVKDDDRVLVLLFSARILIEEEERQIQRQQEAEKKNKK
jgi:hypothetical protein